MFEQKTAIQMTSQISHNGEVREGFGWERVISPIGVIPQAADRVNNDFHQQNHNEDECVIGSHEVLLQVQLLNLDSTSMNNLRQKAAQRSLTHAIDASSCSPAIDDSVAGSILEIVNRRGKMHNPETDSGGDLLSYPLFFLIIFWS
jgi:L-erythro-3,5-diaminohexanoate dehydrogenase